MPDYSLIDIPPLLNMMFHPRQAYTLCPGNAFDFLTTVDEGVEIAARFYPKGTDSPTILYFHGNGEVIYDYDGIAPFYHECGLNLVVADYRGYGASGGVPTFTNLCKDAKSILKSVKKEMAERGYADDLWIMGRSLGSISALELAAHEPSQIKGLIIESGFANILNVMKPWADFIAEMSLPQFDRACLELIQKITVPTLLLHGDEDDIVPYSEADAIYENLGSSDKKMVVIEYANHNDIMFRGFELYFQAIVEFCSI